MGAASILSHLTTAASTTSRASSATSSSARAATSAGSRSGPRSACRYSDAGVATRAFHQVFITPGGLRRVRRTGAFPEGTMLALEIADAWIQRAAGAERSIRGSTPGARSGGEGSPAVAGRLGVLRLRRRHATRPVRRSRRPRAASCHREHAPPINVFTQFYPRLRDARDGIARVGAAESRQPQSRDQTRITNHGWNAVRSVAGHARHADSADARPATRCTAGASRSASSRCRATC